MNTLTKLVIGAGLILSTPSCDRSKDNQTSNLTTSQTSIEEGAKTYFNHKGTFETIEYDGKKVIVEINPYEGDVVRVPGIYQGSSTSLEEMRTESKFKVNPIRDDQAKKYISERFEGKKVTFW